VLLRLQVFSYCRALQSEVTGDEQSEEDTHSFVRFTINEFESYIRTLKSVQVEKQLFKLCSR